MTRRSTRTQSKDAERDVARVLGGRRLTAGQHQGTGDVDVDGGWWLAQVKHTKAVPQWFSEGREQIEEACTATDKVPVLVIKTKPGPGRRARMYVVLDAEDWVSLHGYPSVEVPIQGEKPPEGTEMLTTVYRS